MYTHITRRLKLIQNTFRITLTGRIRQHLTSQTICMCNVHCAYTRKKINNIMHYQIIPDETNNNILKTLECTHQCRFYCVLCTKHKEASSKITRQSFSPDYTYVLQSSWLTTINDTCLRGELRRRTLYAHELCGGKKTTII